MLENILSTGEEKSIMKKNKLSSNSRKDTVIERFGTATEL